jgi:hypothetical protein
MTPPSPDGMPHLDLTGGYSWMMEYAHMAVVGSWIGWWLAGVLLLRSIGFSSRWRDRFSAP